MSDYALDIKVRNARIRRAIRAAGYANVAQFCKAHGLNQVDVGRLLNLKLAPLDQFGKWRTIVMRMCDALMVSPDDLFSDAQRTMAVKQNGSTVEITDAQLQRLAGTAFEEIRRLTTPVQSPDDEVHEEDVRLGVAKLLDFSCITEIESRVLKMRFGIGGEESMTFKEIGEVFGVTSERVRQIEASAMRKIRVAQTHGRLPAAVGELLEP